MKYRNIFITALLLILGLLLQTTMPAASPSKKILIVYYSKTGHTKQMAEAVAKGARSIKGVEVKLLSTSEAKTADALAADAVILGTPVHNASAAIPILEFISRWPFEGSPMKDKIGAVFVTAGAISLGEELTQMNLIHSMLVYGMIVVGGPDWKTAFGASAVTDEAPFKSKPGKPNVNPYFLQKANDLGQRVARLVLRL